MTVDPIGSQNAIAPLADEAREGVPAPPADAGLFSGLVDSMRDAGEALDRAQAAETAISTGQGGLQEMVFERARADAILSIASAGASKATQALNSILNMQV